MDSGKENAGAANDTDVGSHLGNEVDSKCIEHIIIVMSVLMTLNMVLLMFCHRMMVLGKLRKLLNRLLPPERPPKSPAVQGGPRRRPSTDSFHRPPSAGPSVVINNINLPGGGTPTSHIVMMHNPVFSMEDEEPWRAEDRKRKPSVLSDRPLPALPDLKDEDEGERGERMKKSSTGSVMSTGTGKDVDVSSVPGHPGARGTNKAEIFVDVELYV